MSSPQAIAIDRVLAPIHIMPVVVLEDIDHAVPLADALLEGGIGAMELTLRTSAGLPAAEKIAKTRPEMIIGTGTVLTPDDMIRSVEAGAQFAVSPGLTSPLAEAARSYFDSCPLLPGTATASDIMAGLEWGFERVKFFPAKAAGGTQMLKSLFGPFPQVKFCPTSGIKVKTAPDYLSLPNVFCVGGSWLTPTEKLREGDWAGITAIAKEAAGV